MKKPDSAVALSFSLDLPAPMIEAKGQGYMAQKILDLAQEHHIPVENNPLLTQGLIHFDPGQLVPEEYFVILSKIFVQLFDFEKGELRKK